MFRVYLGVRTCELFLCFVAIVRVRVYYVDFFVFFVLRHWRVSQVLTPRQSPCFTARAQSTFHDDQSHALEFQSRPRTILEAG